MIQNQTSKQRDNYPNPKIKLNQHDEFDHSYFAKHGYQIVAEVGRGGYGTVYTANDINDPRESKNKYPKYAVKINFDIVSRPIIFLECSLYYLLKGRTGFPKLHNIFTENSIVHIVLQNFIHVSYAQLFPKMDEMSKVKHYMIELLKCMKTLKEVGIYHRDIKPHNFLYNPETKKGILIDFGLAQLDKRHFYRIKKNFKRHKKLRKHQKIDDELFMEKKTEYDLYKQLYKATRDGGRKKIGTESFVPLESLIYAKKQGYQCEIWSAGVIFLQFISQKYHFFHNMRVRNQSEGHQFKYITVFMLQLAHMFGAEEVKKVLEDNNFEVQMPYKVKKGDLNKILLLKSEDEKQNQQVKDLILQMLSLQPKNRIKVEDAIMHPFFDSVREQHMKSSTDRQWIKQYNQKKEEKQRLKKMQEDRHSVSKDNQLDKNIQVQNKVQEEEENQRKQSANDSPTKIKAQSYFDSYQSSSNFDSQQLSDLSLLSSSEESNISEENIQARKVKNKIKKKETKEASNKRKLTNKKDKIGSKEFAEQSDHQVFEQSEDNDHNLRERIYPEQDMKSKKTKIQAKIEEKKKQKLSAIPQENTIKQSDGKDQGAASNQSHSPQIKEEQSDSFEVHVQKKGEGLIDPKKEEFNKKIFSLFNEQLAKSE